MTYTNGANNGGIVSNSCAGLYLMWWRNWWSAIPYRINTVCTVSRVDITVNAVMDDYGNLIKV